MPVSARARVENVIAKIAADLMRESRTAAGNHLLSKKEAGGLESRLLRDADADLRLIPGKRVKPQEVASKAIGVVRDTIESVNDKGPSLLSQREIKAIADVNPEVAQRAAKAYELITGKQVSISSTSLPSGARVALVDTLVNAFGLARAAHVDVKNVRAVDGGFSFKVASNVFSGDAFAREVDGRFVIAPTKFSSEDFDNAKDAALSFFDRTFIGFMRQWGASDVEIAAARAAFQPTRALLPGEDDPHGGRYPIVFVIDNVSASDHGVYAGLGATGQVDVIAIN